MDQPAQDMITARAAELYRAWEVRPWCVRAWARIRSEVGYIIYVVKGRRA